MKKKSYKRKPGDHEIRILSDGRVVMVGPDEKLMEIAQELDPNSVPTETQDKSDKPDTKRKADAEQ